MKPDPDPLAGLDPKDLLENALSTQPGEKELAEERRVRAAIAEALPDLELVSLLGRGGMGFVYEVRQKKLGRVVALKVLAPRFVEEPGLAERFEREAQALARLTHPNIVTVYDYGREGDLCWLLMEKVDGVNLRRLLDDGGLAPQQALSIVPAVCDALQYAHEAGVVHRDVKPENILVDTKGAVKIADFGLAKIVGGEVALVSLTGTQQVLGTLRYMAPEQLDRPLEVDHRADIYSLGVVFYEMLTGEVPMGRFDPPSKRAHTDPRLDEVVLRALEREPARRYQHASEVKSGVEGVDPRPADDPPVPDRVLSRKAVLSAAFLLVGVGLFLLALVMAGQFSQDDRRLEPEQGVLVEGLKMRADALDSTPEFVYVDLEPSRVENPERTGLVDDLDRVQRELSQLKPGHARYAQLRDRADELRARIANTPETIQVVERELRRNPDYQQLQAELRAMRDRLLEHADENASLRWTQVFGGVTFLLLAPWEALVLVASCLTGWWALRDLRQRWPELYGVGLAMVGAWFLPVLVGSSLSIGLTLGLIVQFGEIREWMASLVVLLHLGVAAGALVRWRTNFLAQCRSGA